MLIPLHSKAEADLSYIREAMARAEGRSSVSGWGIMAMGGVALLAGAIASQPTTAEGQLQVWLIAAPVAFLLAAVLTWLKSRRGDPPRVNEPVLRFLLCFAPPLVVAALLTFFLWSQQLALLPGFWLLLYGCGVLGAGAYAVRPITIMGVAFLAAGAITLTLPENLLNTALAVSFGAIHLYTGWQVSRQHGG